MRILHISDLHFGYGSSKTLMDSRKNCLERLLKKAAEIAETGKIDYLVVSGDIANRGSKTEYDQAAEFLGNLFEMSGVQPSHTIICPGNHDFDREIGSALHIPDTLENASNTYKLESWSSISSPFQEFESFCGRLGVAYPQLTADKQTHLVGVCRFSDVSFVVLNSAWRKNDGPSWVSKSFLEYIEADRLIDNRLLTIAVLHHPSEFLEEFELRAHGSSRPTYSKIEDLADIVLCGHCHTTKIEPHNARTGGGYSIACGASYAGEHYQNSFACYEIAGDTLSVRPFYY